MFDWITSGNKKSSPPDHNTLEQVNPNLDQNKILLDNSKALETDRNLVSIRFDSIPVNKTDIETIEKELDSHSIETSQALLNMSAIRMVE